MTHPVSTYLDSVDSAVVGPVAGRQKINGQCGEQWAVAGRLTERIAPVVAHMDDAVEGLLGGDADVHQIALELGGHSRVKLQASGEGTTGEGRGEGGGGRRRQRRLVPWSTNCLTLWWGEKKKEKKEKLTVSRWQIRFRLLLLQLLLHINHTDWFLTDLICSCTGGTEIDHWGFDLRPPIAVTVSLPMSVAICQ